MNVVEDQVKLLIKQELKAANIKFPLFRSPHEGYAVLKEEAEEASDEYINLEGSLAAVWQQVKANKNAGTPIINTYNNAVHLAVEAIQVAAMCEKFMFSLYGKEANINGNRTSDRNDGFTVHCPPEHGGVKPD